MKASLNLAVYCRVSSEEQTTGGNIHRQIEQAAIEIQRLGLIADGATLIQRCDGVLLSDRYFIDEAYNLEEIKEGTAFFELLERCRSGEINAIYVDSHDRIFRSRSNAVKGQIMDFLEDNEITIFTPSGPVQQGLVLQIMAAMGSEDKKQTLRKLHVGKKIKVQREGRPPNGRAFWGYAFDKTTNNWSTVESEAKVVRWAAAMACGNTLDDMPESLKIVVESNPSGVSDKDVVAALDCAGINLISYFKRMNLRDAERRNPTGKLPRNFLTNIYRDGRYTGQHIYYLKPVASVGKRNSKEVKRDSFPIKIPVIVSSEDWDRAKEARSRRACVTPRHSTQDYLLQGMVYCKTCGGKMSSRSRHNDYYNKSSKIVSKNISKYYTCQSKVSLSRTQPCHHKTYHRSNDLDQAIWARIKEYILSDVIHKIQQKAQSTNHLCEIIKKQKKEQMELQKLASQVDEERGRFLSMLGKQLITEKDWLSQKTRLETEEIKYRKSISSLSRSIIFNEQHKANLAKKSTTDSDLERFGSRLNELTYHEMKSVCSILIHQVVLSSDSPAQLLLKK